MNNIVIQPGNTNVVGATGSFQFQRAYPGVPAGQATFGTLRCAHLAGLKFYKLDMKLFTFVVKKGSFRTPSLPLRVEAQIKIMPPPSAASSVGRAWQTTSAPGRK